MSPDHVSRSSPRRTIEIPLSPSDSRVALYPYLRQYLHEATGIAPSKTSLVRWVTEGYPVAPGGVRVRVPVEYRLRHALTTVVGVETWWKTVQSLADGPATRSTYTPKPKPRPNPKPRPKPKPKPKRSAVAAA